ncbi:NAD-P-binding protein [Lenzites betulinus]|nr:NAD-P-binding protein [Lenzites betulinus]
MELPPGRKNGNSTRTAGFLDTLHGGVDSASHKKFNPNTDLPDLTGKVFIVTGGNAGIGFATIQYLARHGAKVYMAARNEERAKAAIERLQASGLGPGNGEIIWLKLNLSDPRDVVRAAEDFMQKEKRLDVLVNNAALLLIPYEKSHDGLQDIIMVNYIGTCLFTRALLPLLKSTAQEPNSDVRVVCLNSGAHFQCPNDVRFRNLDDLNRDFTDTSFPQYTRYAYSKVMQLLFVRELQRRLDEKEIPILVIATDPGPVKTEGVQAYASSVGPILSPIYRTIANLTFAGPAKGAYSCVFAAASPVPRAEADTYRGAFLRPPARITKPHAVIDKNELWGELWETTDAFLKGLELNVPEV